MKIYTNENNTSTLKLLIAANLAGKKVELKSATFGDDVFAGPRQLPLLEVDDQLTFFSSNAASQFLFPVLDLSENGQCQQMQEWEATRLQPSVAAVLSSKVPPSDVKQALQANLTVVDSLLGTNKFILGNKLSAADISIWSTLYPLCYNTELKQYTAEFKHIARWAEELAAAKAIQEALKQWNGSPNGPFGASSALGAPQLASLLSPVGSPEEVETGPTADEIEAAKENWLNGHKNLQPALKEEKVVLPVKGRKNILITSALPYVNNVPHLGNIIGCVLSADIFARYCRLCDYNTLYICGTDEYGTATETKAIEEGLTPQQICDKYFEIHNAVYRWFNVGFDYFGRTSTKEQTEISQKMFLKLKDNGFVSSQSVEQLLCEKCDRFLADRFVEGTCPHPGCLYDNARGDQCDKCGKLINAIELISPRCKVCGHTPTVKPSSQLFIELGQLEPSLRTWISATEGQWSPPARAVCRAWLREPLRARAVTRDLKWGVPVPVEGFTSKVFYVWFDAPIGYLSITQNATRQYEKWWKPDKEYDVKLYQFMAKDNVPFHTIMFPATLMGINEGHVLVNHLFATEYLNYEEGKFSKSRGVGVFGTDAQDTGIPSDVWRFYLASIRPETSDSSFSWVELGTRNNSELLNNLGNFCHRSLSFCANSFKGKVPDVILTPSDAELVALVNREIVAYVQHMEKGRLRESLRHVLSISRLGNQHMQSEQPWVLLKGSDDDKQRGATAIGLCCQLVAVLCALLAPYVPDTVRKLRAQLNVDATALRINPNNPAMIQYLPSGHVIGKPEPLFAKIEPELLEKLKAKYAGTQSERANVNGDVNKSAAELEAAIAEQGDKVRKLKASTKDKAVWQPEVDKLLQLKKQLAAAQSSQLQTTTGSSGQSAADLEKAIAEQGDKVRKLKASTKDKAVWQPELDKLLQLKKQLAAAQSTASSGSGQNSQTKSAADLEKAIAEQGDKVRKLKASTKDKAVWQPEVNILLDLKKQLASLQVK
ncbi:methionine--tRNA ligase, cytoplasmic isoform X5 [Ostrinia furnacalis]|uniref:methionine--tRNA ligase, cytoplasmic isoform X2 n=1 Tax=Ostrinia furnacalis TaxID=93504 RepID=UPI00103BA4F0|nr:methionine--tRNA ligase, cytoplasmic isoform X2 [Ostrinia furnacalis]XP_028156683.1 methionine--tRNA ligase, cytoplasmic isoform X4 [Ostrinia furnacalis]XP_028156684.1 methionine--tRNA ligase, cytoplasmic isoform X5 [Ostrinia furnacalis]